MLRLAMKEDKIPAGSERLSHSEEERPMYMAVIMNIHTWYQHGFVVDFGQLGRRGSNGPKNGIVEFEMDLRTLDVHRW